MTDDEDRDDVPEVEPARPRRRREPEFLRPTDLLIPSTDVSRWASAAFILGLVGLMLPLLGLVFAVPGFICGLVAVRKRPRANTYGTASGAARAYIGLTLSTLALLAWGGCGLVLIFRA